MSTENRPPEGWDPPGRLIAPIPDTHPAGIVPVRATTSGEPVFALGNERQKQLLQTLEQGTESVLTSEGFAAYLTMLSRFHRYSFNNVILIQAQRPDATLVNAYDRWQRLGRRVKRGERGIKIFYPKKQKVVGLDEETGEPEEKLVVASFGIGNVFDVDQTEGAPLPEPPPVTELTGTDDVATAVNLKLSRFLIDEGITVSSEPMPGTRRGSWNPAARRIAVRSRADASPFAVGPTKTLAHEAAHYLADHRGNVDRVDAEAVAEGAAFVVMTHYGLDVGASSFPYLAGWVQDRAVLRRNLGEIQQVSTRLIAAISGVADPYADG